MATQSILRLNIPASSVAAAAGLNPYSSQEDVVRETWRKMHGMAVGNELTKSLVKRAHSEVLVVYENLVAKDIIKGGGMATPGDQKKQDLVRVINTAAMAEIKDINHGNAATSLQKNAISERFKDTGIAAEAEGMARMASGTQKEGDILADLEMSHDIKIGEKNSVMHTKVMQIDGVDVCIRGKMDGIIQEGPKKGQVVEVKNRRSRFLTPRGGMPPVYEQCQVEMYLWMLKSRELGGLVVEAFNGRSRVTEYQHNPELWEQIVAGLQLFVAEYKKLDQERAAKRTTKELEAAQALVSLQAVKAA